MINLKPTISVTTNDAITQFDPEERGCYAPGEANLTYLTTKRGYRYELNNCILDREIREIIWECRCMPHFATSNSEYLKFIPFCSGKKLYCANMRLKSISMDEAAEADKETMIVQEAKDNPNKIGNITKPAPIKCLPTCQMQETVNEMSFAPYPQKRNFFYQREFCGVASHLRQEQLDMDGTLPHH